MQDFFHPQYVKHKQREKPPFVPLTSSLAVTSQALHQTWIRQGKADSPAKQGWNQTDFHEFSWEDRNIHYQWNFIAGKIHVSDLLESMIFSIIPMGHPLEIRGICREYCWFFFGGVGLLMQIQVGLVWGNSNVWVFHSLFGRTSYTLLQFQCGFGFGAKKEVQYRGIPFEHIWKRRTMNHPKNSNTLNLIKKSQWYTGWWFGTFRLFFHIYIWLYTYIYIYWE